MTKDLINTNATAESLGLAAEDASNFEPAPAGTHLARCIGLIQLGTQETEYQGMKGKSRNKIMLLWELPEEKHVFNEEEGEQPFIVSHIYSLVLGDKATWSIHLDSWMGRKIDKNFNPLTLLGKPCIITISHKTSADGTKIRAKVAGITSLTRGQICPDRVNPIKKLIFAEWDEDIFNEQSEWIQNTIKKSPQYAKIAFGSPSYSSAEEKEEIPSVGKKEEVEVNDLPFD